MVNYNRVIFQFECHWDYHNGKIAGATEGRITVVSDWHTNFNISSDTDLKIKRLIGSFLNSEGGVSQYHLDFYLLSPSDLSYPSTMLYARVNSDDKAEISSVNDIDRVLYGGDSVR